MKLGEKIDDAVVREVFEEKIEQIFNQLVKVKSKEESKDNKISLKLLGLMISLKLRILNK